MWTKGKNGKANDNIIISVHPLHSFYLNEQRGGQFVEQRCRNDQIKYMDRAVYLLFSFIWSSLREQLMALLCDEANT